MLLIRKEQAEVFRNEKLLRFEENAIRHLRLHLGAPTAGFSDLELRQRVNRCIGRAGAYGLASEQQVMCFVDTTFLIGEGFDADPRSLWARDVLDSEKLEPGQKASILLAIATNVYNGEPGGG